METETPDGSEPRPNGERKGRNWGLAAALVVTVLFLALSYASWRSVDPYQGLDVETDDAALASTDAQLNEIAVQLDALPAPKQTRARRAERLGCITGEGVIHQPSVSRTWTILGADPAKATRELGQQLTTGSDRWKVEEIEAQPDVRTITFTSPDGWTASGAIFPTFQLDEVKIEVKIVGAAPCRLVAGEQGRAG